MHEVEVAAVPLEGLRPLLAPERWQRLHDERERARDLLVGRVVWNVNATAHGGGVAEMLQNLLAYGRGAGVETRWLVLSGSDPFFSITKRLHNFLHGSAGDGGSLGDAERAIYEQVLRENMDELSGRVRPGDIVVLHDPQTAGMIDAVRSLGARAVWRCHVGSDSSDHLSSAGWSFLQRYIENADSFVFSRRQYAPHWVPPSRLTVICPSIDPLSAKNRYLDPSQVQGLLVQAGLVGGGHDGDGVQIIRRDGSLGTSRTHSLAVGEAAPPFDAALVVQVSRWDRLKDMSGVLAGYAAAIDTLPDNTHLMLVGPDVSGVSDDPEGSAVLADCRDRWERLPRHHRRRIHLVCLPMDDVDENAYLVNALQRHATIVVQKSLVEGFGLTVTEAMWKERPVIASAVGGINDQIVDGRDGLLLQDPADLEEFGRALKTLLDDRPQAARLASNAKSRVQDLFLGDRHLIDYVNLFANLVASGAADTEGSS